VTRLPESDRIANESEVDLVVMVRKYLEFQFDRSKFKECVLYICSRCDASNLGSVKLHKTLYFADMLRYVWQGHPITGETYQKSRLGPTSRHLHWTLKLLEREDAIEVRKVPYFGYLKSEYLPRRQPNLACLAPDEVALLDEVIDFVCRNNTAKDISELRHSRAWEITALGEEIPYHTAFLIFPSVVSEEAMEWAEGEAQDIEDQRSKSNPVGYTSLADFRGRILAR
jgi:hypothetical protein